MSVIAQSSGTQTATVGTEHILADVAIPGVYTFHVDTVNMVSGDTVELRVYQVALTGGTKRVAFFQPFFGAQLADDIMKVSFPIGNDLTDATSLEFTLKQTFGVSKQFGWKILKY